MDEFWNLLAKGPFWPVIVPLGAVFAVLTALTTVMQRVGEKTDLITIITNLFQPRVREPIFARRAAWFVIAAIFSLSCAAWQVVRIFGATDDVPALADVLIGSISSLLVGGFLFGILRLLKVSMKLRWLPWVAASCGLLLGATMVVGAVAIQGPEQIDIIIAVAAPDPLSEQLESELGEFRRVDDRVTRTRVDGTSSRDSAEAILASSKAEFILFGSVRRSGEGFTSDLRIVDADGVVPVSLDPADNQVACAASQEDVLLRGVAQEIAMSVLFSIAYVDVVQNGPKRGLETLHSIAENFDNGRLGCDGVHNKFFELADVPYAKLLESKYAWASDARDELHAAVVNSGQENDPLLWRYWGEALLLEGRFDEAADAFRNATQIDPQYKAAYLRGARASYHAGNYCLAVDLYTGEGDQTVELDAENAELLEKSRKECTP